MHCQCKKFYTVIQSHASICKTLKVVSGKIKHFCWCDNTWLDIYVNFFYIISASKLNSNIIIYTFSSIN